LKIQLRPIGARLALVLPDAILDQLGIAEDTVLELNIIDDGKGLEIRPVPKDEPAGESTQWFNLIQPRLSPAARRLLDHLRAHAGCFFEPEEVPLGRKTKSASQDAVFVVCGRAAFHDPQVLMLAGRIGYLAEGVEATTVQPEWSFQPLTISKSDRAAHKDAIVLRHLNANRGRLVPREEVYGELHRQWRGEGSILLRDVDMCAARLAFGHPGIVVHGTRVGLLPKGLAGVSGQGIST
jgi:antitoxin component of MazEF toxin-antitoxin module